MAHPVFFSTSRPVEPGLEPGLELGLDAASLVAEQKQSLAEATNHPLSLLLLAWHLLLVAWHLLLLASFAQKEKHHTPFQRGCVFFDLETGPTGFFDWICTLSGERHAYSVNLFI